MDHGPCSPPPPPASGPLGTPGGFRRPEELFGGTRRLPWGPRGAPGGSQWPRKSFGGTQRRSGLSSLPWGRGLGSRSAPSALEIPPPYPGLPWGPRGAPGGFRRPGELLGETPGRSGQLSQALGRGFGGLLFGDTPVGVGALLDPGFGPPAPPAQKHTLETHPGLEAHPEPGEPHGRVASSTRGPLPSPWPLAPPLRRRN